MTATPKAAPERIYLFCYGTLKRGEPGHELMGNATFVATVMRPHLRWIREAEYPSCIETEDATDFVVGEIWDVPMSDLPIINEYEGRNYTLVRLMKSNLHAYLLVDKSDKFVGAT
jgi:gamma-glutamylcyclotransferase (GGCT)/AIG2-like uncharacterized protein YtfP